MKCSEQQRGAVLVFKPTGPIVEDEARGFADRVREVARERLGRVVVDASGVAYVDSTGLESLVDVATELSTGGQALKLCSVSPTLREVLELTGVAPQFELFDDANSAVRSFL